MLGAIAGDVAGSVYEFHPLQAQDWRDFDLFPKGSRFTDDTVMTLAVAEALRLSQSEQDLPDSLIDNMHKYGRTWPKAGYGCKFSHWLLFRWRHPYNSYGNGSAMRVSSAGWAARTLAEAEDLALQTASVTHNHPEGIKGAQSVAGAIFLARQGKSRADIKAYVSSRYGYDLDRTLAEIRPKYKHIETCQDSVPEAIIAFLESENFEEALRKAIWLHGDADTQAAIAGSIAEAFYGGVPEAIAKQAMDVLDERLKTSYEQNWAWLQERGKI